MKRRLALRAVIVWSNGTTMVFDHGGYQVPQLQGRVEDKWPSILGASDERTRFETGVWRDHLRPMTAREIATGVVDGALRSNKLKGMPKGAS